MLRKFKSIRTKIIILYLILLIITLLASGYFLQRALKDYFSDWMDKKIIREARLVRGILKPLIEKENLTRLRKSVNEYGEELAIRITVIDRDGLVLADSREEPARMDNHLYRPEIQVALQDKIGKKIRYSNTLDINMRYIALPIKEEGRVIGVIRVALSLEKLHQLYRGMWIVLFEAGIIALLISILLSIKFASQITGPIREITSAAQKIAAGFLNQEIVVKTKDEIGKLARTFNHMLTKIRQKVDQISNEKSKMEAIITSIGDGIIAVDNDKQIILINRAAEEIFGIKKEKVMEESSIQVTKNYKLDEIINQALKDAQPFTEEIELLLPEERIFRTRSAPIERDGEITGVVISLRDITEIRKLERMRSEFVSNVSHELKTPLTSIKGYVETLLESEPDLETYRSFLGIIEDEASRLERLIEDILSLSKIETGNYFSKEKVAIEEIIDDLKPVLNPKAEVEGVNLSFDLAADLPVITGDYDKLFQALINLIDNGIKYTPSGGEVEVRSFKEDEELIIEIEDNGIGIPDEDLPRIFERFYRVDKARSRKLGGTGLGLSIVKHIIEQHNGSIQVESQVNVGTMFILKLPI